MAQWAENVLGPASLLALFVAGLVTIVALRRLDETPWPGVLRRRFVHGVPWATAIVVALILFVYLVVQGAWTDLTDPLVVPFRSWSYAYPLGMATSSFAHSNLGHVTGNLLATVVFAPVVEYAWGHYPSDQDDTRFERPRDRIAVFVAVVVLVGLAGSLFAPGPSIGFSGVVFAFAGFALVVTPVRAIMAIVGVRVVRTLYYAVTDPAPVAVARTQYVTPWFANVSIQGHAFGVLVGILLGLAVLRARSRSPPLRHVWYATIVFGVMETLYAFYWYQGAESFQLFRGAGVALVLLVGVVVITAVRTTDSEEPLTEDIGWKHLAGVVLIALVLGIAIAAVPYNLADVQPPDREGTVEIRDYTVYYAEDVPHGYATAVDLPFVGNASDSARASGVVVTSPRRNAWEEVVPAGRLALDGHATVSVGGLGWRERVMANRTGWDAVDAGETYTVYLRPAGGGSRTLAYAADPVALAPTIAGRNLTIEPADAGYFLNVTQQGRSVEAVSLPASNETSELTAFSVERHNDSLFVSRDGTRIRVAKYTRSGR